MATSVAFQILHETGAGQLALPAVEGGIWQPHLSWGTAYLEAWEQNRRNWTARLTIHNYLLLQRFGFLPPG